MQNATLAQYRRDNLAHVLKTLESDTRFFESIPGTAYQSRINGFKAAYNEILSASNSDEALCNLSRNSAEYFSGMPSWGTFGT